MPTIQDMLHQCGGMAYATVLDMIMSYYAMNFREDMQKYLVIILPWSKYVYNKTLMELKISADSFQRDLIMIFQNMPYVLVYIDGSRKSFGKTKGNRDAIQHGQVPLRNIISGLPRLHNQP